MEKERGHKTGQQPVTRYLLLAVFGRLPLLLLGSLAAISAYRASGVDTGMEAGAAWSTVSITLVNLLTLAFLLWRAGVEGFRLKDWLDFRRSTLVKDILLGVLLSMGLFALLSAGLMVTLLLISTPEKIASGEAFVGTGNFTFSLPAWVAYASAIAFPVLNPFVEELNYRGYAQRGLTYQWGKGTGIIVTALGFGIQHAAFAITPTSAIAYSVGFFLWGLGAGWIARKQGRLAQLVVAHFISNLAGGVIPLLFIR